jgi:hypothetical protein
MKMAPDARAGHSDTLREVAPAFVLPDGTRLTVLREDGGDIYMTAERGDDGWLLHIGRPGAAYLSGVMAAVSGVQFG